MTQPAACVPRRLAESAEPTQHLKAQEDAIAQTENDAVGGVVETLLPVEEVAMPNDKPLPRGNDEVKSVKAFASDSWEHYTIAPVTLKKFRRGYGEDAAQVATQIKQLVVTSAEGILLKARLVLDMKLRLNRKEWGVWLKEMLGWFNNEATQYLQIAKAFCDFDPGVFSQIEPFVLLKLRTKRYAPVVLGLREQLALTSQMVQDFIKELLPKQSRKKSSEPISGWKATRSGGGRYYNVLLHSEEVGLSIEQQAATESILPQRVIAEAVALRAQRLDGSVQVSDERLAQLSELQDVVDNARELEREKRQLELELSDRDRLIAELQTKLALGVVPLVVEADGIPWDELTVASDELNEPESLLMAHAPDNTTQPEPTTTSLDDSKEPHSPADSSGLESPCQSLEIAQPGFSLVEQPESALVLSPGDLVEINVTRPNGDKTWNGLRGYIQNLYAPTGKMAVLLQGDYRSKQFKLDELKLVEVVSATPSAVVTPGVEVEQPSLVVEQADLAAVVTPQDAVVTPGVEVEQPSLVELTSDAADNSGVESNRRAIATSKASVQPSAVQGRSPLPDAHQKSKFDRKLQPVEILTKTGEWISGYFLHACIVVANFANTDRQFTLFNADGEMYNFFGQVRPLKSGVALVKYSADDKV
jgi:hypothetical protein